jgi:SRSO17 transposase
MLPASRCEGDLYAIPKFSLDMDELHGFHEAFRDCFMRSEPRENFLLYMAGQQFGALERKSIEPIALQVEDGNVRAMQRFVIDVVWNEEIMLKRYHALVAEDMGDPEGTLIFTERGYPLFSR